MFLCAFERPRRFNRPAMSARESGQKQIGEPGGSPICFLVSWTGRSEDSDARSHEGTACAVSGPHCVSVCVRGVILPLGTYVRSRKEECKRTSGESHNLAQPR